ncbi:hypothetical protein BJY01DRAFT_209156 [Aspergillus pseudoustus]|uniref:Secreted protein n=1 Tax=Aspergillus pseudoustus TaxID=1810923 RepID=A0ABR4KGX1_9EURO
MLCRLLSCCCCCCCRRPCSLLYTIPIPITAITTTIRVNPRNMPTQPYMVPYSALNIHNPAALLPRRPPMPFEIKRPDVDIPLCERGNKPRM